MRLKEFIIVIFFFTVFYILFFVIFDKIVLSCEQKRTQKRMDSILDEDRFTLFAQFYGIQSTVTKDILQKILNEIPKMPSTPISTASINYQLSPYEFVVAVVYLEYHHLMELKEVYFEGNVMIPIRQNGLTLLTKYQPFFASKLTYEQILQNAGQPAVKELSELNQLFLCPGVRIIGNQIYYVGDGNET